MPSAPNATHQVVTRFAPSPTGALHVGGARTALFNWAFARRHKGQFIIRIEDTDQARSTPQATRGILEDLKWLGIDWDQGPVENAADPYVSQKGGNGSYFQSQRLDIYRRYCDELLAKGRAYECFRTPQDLAAEREKARAEKRDWKYDPAVSLAVPMATREQWKREGKPYVVRFRAAGHDLVIQDQVLGEVVVKAEQLEDFVIFKSDGFPTYHFAVVVDDELMGVTHVIRAQEHLSNTPKHVALQAALGFRVPNYAHLPLIFNIDGTKMSKRDKAKVARQAVKEKGVRPALSAYGIDDDQLQPFLSKKSDDLAIALAIAKEWNLQLPEIDVADFRRSGYLPQVILNYIALLGWSPKNNIEKFTMEFLVENFSFEGVNKGNARFDRDKLRAFNGDALRALPAGEFEAALRAFAGEYHRDAAQRLGVHFSAFAAAYRERSSTLNDPFVLGEFFFLPDDAIKLDAKAVDKVLRKNDGAGCAALAEVGKVFVGISDWTAAAIHQAIEQHAAATGKGMGDIAQPLRVAASGSTVSPPIHDTLAILGKEATLKRIERCLAAVL